MGGLLGRPAIGNGGFPPRPSGPDLSLRYQTFVIKGRPYTFIEWLGGGAFGSVWSARAADGQPAAVKTIDLNRRGSGQFDPLTLINSFEKEIKMAYAMRQETRHVVTIYGFDFNARTGLALMAMELGGDTLTKRVERLHYMKGMQRRQHRGRDAMMMPGRDYISSRERKNIWVQLVEIVLTLHRHHVVHRDMKPDNLVFFGPVMKIVDLGIAQKEAFGFGRNVEGIGTPFYSAPECFVRGAHMSSKADIWSAGAILYYMTYGREPEQNSPRPPYRVSPTNSPSVADVLNGCLQRNSEMRGSHTWLATHPYSADPSSL